MVDEMLLRSVQPLEYFETVYIGSGGSRSRFPPSPGNAHFQTHRAEHGTNNLCEGWNNKFSILVGHSHPTFWNRIAGPQKDEAASRRTIIQHRLREEVRQQSSICSTVGTRLLNLCMQFRRVGIFCVDFLRSYSYNL